MHNHSNYLEDVFCGPEKFAQTVENVANSLKGKAFDYIVCRGVSGIAVASAVAFVMKKNLVVVRKQNEDSHASYRVEGIPNCDKPCTFVIVDDFVCSGRTVAHMLYEVGGANKNAQCLGMASYKYGCSFTTLNDLNKTKQIGAVAKNDWAPGICRNSGDTTWSGYIKSEVTLAAGERFVS